MATRGRPISLNHLYSSAKWRRIRKLQLLHSRLCVLCLKRGVIRQRPSAITSLHTLVTSTSSGWVHFKACANNVTTMRRNLRKIVAIFLISGSTAFQFIRAIRQYAGSRLAFLKTASDGQSSVLASDHGAPPSFVDLARTFPKRATRAGRLHESPRTLGKGRALIRFASMRLMPSASRSILQSACG